MLRLTAFFFIVVITLSIPSYLVYSQERGKISSRFYSDLADIIENNKNNPERVNDEVGRYIETNRRTLERMDYSTERETRSGKSYRQPALNSEEPEISLTETNLTQAVSRFSETFSEFSSAYPNEANEIKEALSEFTPE